MRLMTGRLEERGVPETKLWRQLDSQQHGDAAESHYMYPPARA
jgi:hypothetical protein